MSFWLMMGLAAFTAACAVMFARIIESIWDGETIGQRIFHIAVFGWFLAVIGMFGFFATSLPTTP